jgi:uncharacterized protein YxjI
VSGLLTMSRWIVNQRAKLIEMTTEYRILDEQGAQVGVVRQEGQTALKKAARFLGNVDQFMTHRFSVYDAEGSKVLGITRPRKILKSKVEVTDGQGLPVGTIVQQNVIGKIRFGLQGPSGEELGAILGQNWRAWDFHVVDAQGQQVGSINKRWAGLGRELFTTADNYVVEVAEHVQGPLRLLALAAGAGIDTALKQAQG